jgi:MerR family transcriptional regulator, thiopeptide resistance regulator
MSGNQANGEQAWKVGELARVTGLTVRALHHYDHIGLLSPSLRTSAGHRLYTADDVARLYRVCLLRRLGFPLGQITSVLDDPEWQLGPAVQRHLQQTQYRAAIAARLCSSLTVMAAELDRQQHLPADQLFSTLEEMTMLDTAINGTTSFLVYDDLAAAHDYITRIYGLTPGLVERNADGAVIHAEVQAGDHLIMLHPGGEEYRSPRSLGGVTSMTVVAVTDVDAHYAHSVEAGADILKEPVNQDYGVREYGARDLEGQLWYFHQPIG